MGDRACNFGFASGRRKVGFNDSFGAFVYVVILSASLLFMMEAIMLMVGDPPDIAVVVHTHRANESSNDARLPSRAAVFRVGGTLDGKQALLHVCR